MIEETLHPTWGEVAPAYPSSLLISNDKLSGAVEKDRDAEEPMLPQRLSCCWWIGGRSAISPTTSQEEHYSL